MESSGSHGVMCNCHCVGEWGTGRAEDQIKGSAGQAIRAAFLRSNSGWRSPSRPSPPLCFLGHWLLPPAQLCSFQGDRRLVPRPLRWPVTPLGQGAHKAPQPWLPAILVNPKGHMNLMMGCSVCFFIRVVMMGPRHGVTAWRQPEEKKKYCRIAGFKELIPIIMLLSFLKRDKHEKSIS